VKSGVEQRGKLIFAIVLGVIALFAFWTAMRSRPTVAGAAAPAATSSQPSAPRVAQRKGKISTSGQKVQPQRSLDPTLHFDYLVSEKVEYKGSRCNIFTGDCEKQVEVVRETRPAGPDCSIIGPNRDPSCGPPPPDCRPGAAPDSRCPPPPIPLQFFGFASRPGEPQRIFLRTTDTNDVFVAGVGEVVNRRYRVLRIMGSGVEVEDVLNNNKQVLPLQQGG
jgi:hypothetical protein